MIIVTFVVSIINIMTEVKFYNPSYTPEINLTYSVVAAKYGDDWLYVRHQKRKTWEIPGGHIEKDESADEAARRELTEETGALEFTLECVSTYSVLKNGKTGYGRLYLAKVFRLGPVPDISEIAEVKIMDSLPRNLTHPDIQPHLYKRVLDYLSQRDSCI